MPSRNERHSYPALGMAGLAILSQLCGCLGSGDTVGLAVNRRLHDSTAPGDPLPARVGAGAISTTTFSDATGRIQIGVKACDPTPVNFTNCAYCTVDDGWARIGGGAQILGEASPGAMLQASFPDPNYFTSTNSHGCTGTADQRQSPDFMGTWVARASGANHQLQAYVIGIRMLGNDGVWFKPLVTEGRDDVTSIANPPITTIKDSPGEYSGAYLVGGGAYIYKGDGNLNQATVTEAYLAGSYPVDGANGRAWRGVARHHQIPATQEIMKSFGIFLSPCPPEMSPKCVTYPTIRSVTAAVASGYGTANLTIPEFQVSGSIGGYARFSSGGPRYLADLIPFHGSSQGFTVRSQAYATGTGQTTGYALVFGLPFDIYTAVYNHSNKCMGILNARTDATAPVAQQTCTFGNQPSNARFAMVPRPGGYVALRFEHSGMCVDIGGSSQNNGAAAIQYPCAYTDNQLVQLLNNGPGKHYFKFKHSGKCLDVTGSSTADGARFIQYTCSGQPNQAFHFED
jgi:hypothetical protein